MEPFAYERPTAIADALRSASKGPPPTPTTGVRFLAGGTSLIDLMKLDVETPRLLLDINALPLASIDTLPDGGLRIGALVRNSDLAADPRVSRDYPVLAQALLAGASAQLRNKATTAGNILQRTRCLYFRDPTQRCNKRQPGSGCAAIGGANRSLAVLGTSDHCIATNPSDMNVALMALGATVQIEGTGATRDVAFADFYLLPGQTPHTEHVLRPGELIRSVTLGRPVPGAKSYYLKLRDRASYEFALASAAVVVSLSGGRIASAQMALGGVGTRPWRSRDAEDLLKGREPGTEAFQEAAEVMLRGARAQSENAFKIPLAKKCLIYALNKVTTA